ncbi:bacteriohemerythrin [Haliea sp. E17]|uniref:bacteriohemerythrin n=1 Tax=Haliea sp. E17 TaxID=3401576 RepID=UPI003AAE6C7D
MASDKTPESPRTAAAAGTSLLAPDLVLGEPQMDDTHREFLALAQLVAHSPATALAPAMQELFEHTREHFSSEESRMQQLGHPLLGEHRADHQRILGDMERLCQRAEAGRGQMARAWVSDNLMEWFAAHARTMDSALAADMQRGAKDNAEN